MSSKKNFFLAWASSQCFPVVDLLCNLLGRLLIHKICVSCVSLDITRNYARELFLAQIM